MKKFINREEFEFWLPTLSIDELKNLKKLVEEEIKESKKIKK